MTEQLTPYTNYQLSAIGVGVIATGLADIRQCIDIILRTIPGSDPLRPLFGCEIHKYSDAPTNIKIPNMKLAIFEALELWEPRIKVSKIGHELKTENVFFAITYQITDSDLLDTYEWASNGGIDTGSSNGIVLSAVIPAKITNGHYSIDLKINNTDAYPSPPVIGFDTADAMLAWVTANWSSFGSWYLTDNKIVLYLKDQNVTKASLTVSQSAIFTVKAQIPQLEPGEYFGLDFTVNGSPASPLFPTGTISNVEQMLNWLGNNYSHYGTWSIFNNGVVTTAGDFSSDFNKDFSIGGLAPDLYIVFQTKDYETATLNIY